MAGMTLSKTQSYALLHENRIADLLRSRNYTVHQPASFFADYDLIINGSLPIEIKASRPGKHYCKKYLRYRYIFDLRKIGNTNQNAILWLVCDAGHQYHDFIIPYAYLLNRRQITISGNVSRYSGFFAQFLNAYQNLDHTYYYLAKQLYELSFFNT